MEKNKKVLKYQEKFGKMFTLEAKANVSMEINDSNEAKAFFDKVPQKVARDSKADSEHPYALVVECLQASAFFNKNDHYFIPTELWKARASSKYMLVDWEHDREQIIGCISDSYAVKDSTAMGDDSLIDDNTAFDIYNEIVVWKNVFPDYAEKIVDMHKEGKLFVSMECTYEDFDFALQKGSDEVIVVARNEETDFLIDYIRVFGGSGKYEDYKVGIAFRNISFVGTGFCEKPANSRSYVLDVKEKVAEIDTEEKESGVNIVEIIKNNSYNSAEEKDLESVASENKVGVKDFRDNFFGKGEVMSLEERFEKAQEELLKAKQEIIEKDSKIESVAKNLEDAKTALAEKEEILEELTKTKEDIEAANIKTIEDIKAEYEEKLAKVEEEKASINEKLAEIAKAEMQRARKEEIAGYDVEIEDEELFSLSDSEYAAIKKYAPKKTEEVAEETEEEAEEQVTEEDIEETNEETNEEEAKDTNAVSEEKASERAMYAQVAKLL